MKTKMKMKNNRMLLALVMVAALAMVSVAGVAVIADDSDAVDNTFVPDQSETVNMVNSTTPGSVYNVYLPAAATAATTMIATFSGTGTINFGWWDAAGTTYTVVDSITFTDVSGYTVVITCTAGGYQAAPTAYTFTVCNTAPDTTPIAPTGAITVALGDVTFGKTGNSFDGTVTAGAATVKSVGTIGAVISVQKDGTAYMSGSLTANATTLATVTTSYKSTLTVDGKIAIGNATVAKTLTVNGGVELIINGDITMPASVAANTITITGATALEPKTSGTMTVNGTITAGAATGTKAVIAVTTFGTIQVNGTISGLDKEIATTADTPVNAAHYTVTANTTITYTTLANAMKASSAITITGNLFITEDTILTGNSTTTPVLNSITVAPGATLNIGTDDTIGADGKIIVPGKAAVVTVPTTTTLTVTGTVIVNNGQLKTADTTPVANIKSDVFMTGIYTDLTTALGLSASGDTVTLRAGAIDVTISTDAEVKAGVKLFAGDIPITVAAGGKLTINGEISATATGIITIDGKDVMNSRAAGQLVINADTKAVSIAEIKLAGVLTIGTESDLKTTKLNITISGTEAVININGVFDFTGTFAGDAANTKAVLNITGKAVTAITAGANIGTMGSIINVSGTWINKSAIGCDELNVTGSGTVNGIVSGVATITVYTKMTVGTPATGITESINNATVTGVKLNTATETGPYAVVYGTAAKVVMDSSCKTTAFYFGKVLYATEYVNGVAKLDYLRPALTDYDFGFWADQFGDSIKTSAAKIGEYTAVYGTTSLKTYSVTFDYNPGVTWIVDGTVMSSTSVNMLTVGVHTIKVDINPGYSGNVKMTASGNVTVSDGKLTVSGNGAVSASGVSVKDGGLDITEILLIILVVIIALLAIIVVFKMLRS